MPNKSTCGVKGTPGGKWPPGAEWRPRNRGRRAVEFGSATSGLELTSRWVMVVWLMMPMVAR